MSNIIPVILAGGSGTRLWPRSRSERPKQFLPLIGAETLFQQTLLRLRDLGSVGDPIVICNESHRFIVAEQLREIGIARFTIVLEPAGRNTAPAIAVAALLARDVAGALGATGGSGEGLPEGKESPRKEPPVLLVLPADHVIGDTAAFVSAIGHAIDGARRGRLVTFGVVPTHPETGYGYIEVGAGQGSWRPVERFVEKPDAATAERYVESGRYLWNSGMFVFATDTLLDELARYAPKILAACERAVAEARMDEDFTRLGSSFLDSPSNSIDYAVMEKTDRAAVVPLDAGWSDVGSWAALHEVSAKDDVGNVLHGDVISEGCSGSLIRAHSRLVAAFGLRDVIVVETADAVLVVNRSDAQQVKRAVEMLERKGRSQ